MDFRINRRLVVTILAVAFAAETVGVVAAAFPGETSVALAERAPVGDVLAAEATPDPATSAPVRVAAPVLAVAATPSPTPPAPSAAPSLAATAQAEATPKPTKAPKPKATPKPAPKATPKPAPKATPKPKPKATAKPKTFSGTNHVWIPALGISKSVHAFPCERTRPPDNYMYRWGCSGANNVYLMGHAYSVMKPLHDAYYNGRLKVGMKAYYAGSNGKVHAYAVKWWKKTLPTPDASWAWAPQPVPSMTLQTCVGKDSKYRLMVRLVDVRG
jgi:hypothetical protein